MQGKIHKLNIDEGLPRRVLNTSVTVAIVIFLVSLSQWSHEVTIGLGIGMGISIVFSMVLYNSMKTFLLRKTTGSILFFAAVTILKFIALGTTLFFSFKYLPMSYPALLAGVGLVQVVISLKLAGMGMVNYMNRTNSGRMQEL